MRHYNENKPNHFTRSIVDVFVLAVNNYESLNPHYRGMPATRVSRPSRLFDVQQQRINIQSARRNDGWDNQPPMMPV